MEPEERRRLRERVSDERRRRLGVPKDDKRKTTPGSRPFSPDTGRPVTEPSAEFERKAAIYVAAKQALIEALDDVIDDGRAEKQRGVSTERMSALMQISRQALYSLLRNHRRKNHE